MIKLSGPPVGPLRREDDYTITDGTRVVLYYNLDGEAFLCVTGTDGSHKWFMGDDDEEGTDAGGTA